MTKKKPSKRPPKETNLLEKVRQAIQSGDYLDVVHAQERQQERQITRPEYEYVLQTGFHEKAKDEFKPEYQTWNYAIRGKTIDQRELRVIVTFEDGLLIITVIDLEVK